MLHEVEIQRYAQVLVAKLCNEDSLSIALKQSFICLASTGTRRNLGIFFHTAERSQQQLCGGMAIPCRLVFSHSSKVKINHLKELSENKNCK